jgi:hypothetical protein
MLKFQPHKDYDLSNSLNFGFCGILGVKESVKNLQKWFLFGFGLAFQ